MVKIKKVGLALSGGGARGLAHIGVLKVFEKYNIPIIAMDLNNSPTKTIAIFEGHKT